MTTTAIDRCAVVPATWVVAEPASRALWRSVCADDPLVLPEQEPEWTDAVTDSGRFRAAARSYTTADGRRFVLPLVARRGPFGAGGQLWSMPEAWGIGGLAGQGQDRAVVDAVVDDLRRLRATRVSIRIDPLDEPHWSHLAGDPRVVRVPRRAHVLELRADDDAQLAAMRGEMRSRLRRSTRRGVTVETVPGDAAIHLHRRLFDLSVDRWAARSHEPAWLAHRRAEHRDPESRLHLMARHLGERFVVVIGRVDGVPAASAVVLLGRTTRYTRAAMDVDVAGRSEVSVAVQWAAIQLARRYGSTSYNMGESGDAPGLSAFKEGFGAAAVPYGEYRIERLPFTEVDRAARAAVKRVIGFVE